jgi:hypothetical protein
MLHSIMDSTSILRNMLLKLEGAGSSEILAFVSHLVNLGVKGSK